MTTHFPSKIQTLALALTAAALLPTSARAAATEAQLDSIKLYNNVTIADDKVTDWGPWTEFEAPAAGSPPVNLQVLNSELYRVLPQVAAGTPGTPVAPPSDSVLMGLGGMFKLTPGSAIGGDVSIGAEPFAVFGTPVQASASGNWLPDALVLNTTNTASVPAAVTGTLRLQGDGLYTGSNGAAYTTLQRVQTGDPSIDNEANQVAFFQLMTYIKPDDERAIQGQGGLIVLGNRTSTTDMASLVSGKVTASYAGQYMTSAGTKAPMIMFFDFGKSIWSATWQDPSKNPLYSAGGKVTGAYFNSNTSSIQAPDITAVSVNGGLFGPKAVAAAGVSNIVRNGQIEVNNFVATQVVPK